MLEDFFVDDFGILHEDEVVELHCEVDAADQDDHECDHRPAVGLVVFLLVELKHYGLREGVDGFESLAEISI
jgi:hypothetical protein